MRLYGADRIVMGTDYPFDMADYDPVGHVCGAGLDAATVAAICGGNAKRLLGLVGLTAVAASLQRSVNRWFAICWHQSAGNGAGG